MKLKFFDADKIKKGNKISTTHEQNLALKKELWERGYFVMEIGQEGEVDYLIVSCAPPKDTIPIGNHE